MSKKEIKQKVVFSADLAMTRIAKTGIRYRLENPKGMPIKDLHHVEVERDFFPVDDNFSLDFMGAKIEATGNPKKHTEDYLKAIKSMQEKQAEFLRLKGMKLIILMD